ncbi:hypothetical protein [Sphingobacterium sp. SYP-B4668]|uniref:hypothetical protein n=1 Tax=Sphingobacterium sp. SYP-B4668 TaxID=2996035 RepID=UPI0022DD7F1A|nr:hypothetical protein [Sphingobacterium sp. SYP-B4668]
MYRLTDEVIYRKSGPLLPRAELPKDFKPKYAGLLSEMLAYLGVDQLCHVERASSTDALLVNLTDVQLDEVIKLMNARKLVVVDRPFATPISTDRWNRLVFDQSVVLSINLFHFGILLYRDGQQKENFVLRYPYWRPSEVIQEKR